MIRPDGHARLGECKASDLFEDINEYQNSAWKEISPVSFQILSTSHDVTFMLTLVIQNVPGGKFNILGDHSIGHSKKVDMNMCPIPNGFRDRAI
jgi:hypothetical protein